MATTTTLHIPKSSKVTNTDGTISPDYGRYFDLLTPQAAVGPTIAQATFFVRIADTNLPNARVATDSATVTLDYSTPGHVTWNAAGANVFQTTVTLSNADVKALPTTPVSLVAAQGTGTRIVPLQIDLEADFTAGAYTNINADSVIYAGVGDSSSVQTNYIANDSTTPLTFLSSFLGATHSIVTLLPFTHAEPVGDWGNLAYVAAVTTTNLNAALSLFGTNNGAGNWTGGNAANTLVVRTWWALVS